MGTCGCCSLKTGSRIGALWTMVESIAGIVLLLLSGMIGQGNILSIVTTSFFVVVFCAAWILLSGVYREIASILYAWVAVYVVFILMRLTFLGFVVAGYSEMTTGKPVTYDFVFMYDGTALSQTPEMFESYKLYIVGGIAGLAVSIIFSAWVLIGVICLGVDFQKQQWKEARLQDPYY